MEVRKALSAAARALRIWCPGPPRTSPTARRNTAELSRRWCPGPPRHQPIALIYCYAHIAQLVPGASANKFHSTLDHCGAVAQAVCGLLRSNRPAVFDPVRVYLAEVRCCYALTAQQLELPRSQPVAGTSIMLWRYAAAAEGAARGSRSYTQ